MDLFGFKKRKKQKNFDAEVHIAIGAQLDKFSEGASEHFKSFDPLVKISESKINPEYSENNLRQQAGFSAEVKTTARKNADSVINGKKSKISRTDDVGDVNHPKYDHVEVDSKGNPLRDASGNYIKGSQQKVFKEIKSYRKIYSKEYEHYKGAIIDVPSDQFELIKRDFDSQVSKLDKQYQSRIDSGDLEEAKKIQKKIDQINDTKGRLRDADVSTDDALDARLNPTISVAKDIAKIAHKSGLESAKSGAILCGGISTIKNTADVFNGEKKASEAVQDIVKDTTVSSAKAYASGAATSVVGGALKSSTNLVANNMAKGNTPVVIVQTGVILAKNISELVRGNIDGAEFSKNIGKEGTVLATSLTGANLGAVLGTAILPGVGTVVGGVIGGITASMMSSSLYAEIQKSVNETDLSNEQRKAIREYCETLIIQERKYREYAMSVYDSYFDKKEMDIKDGFKSVSLAIQNGGDINQGLMMIGDAFDLELKFNDLNEFKKYIEKGKVLEL